MTEERREPDFTDLYGLVLSSSATTRARFSVILQCISRIMARLENRDETELLEELKQMLEEEMAAESDELKEYMRSRGR